MLTTAVEHCELRKGCTLSIVVVGINTVPPSTAPGKAMLARWMKRIKCLLYK